MISSKTKEFAKLVNNESKIAMIQLLMSKKFYTVNELARAAKIKPHTASYHLKKMQGLQLITMEKHGRFHYYQLIDQEFAAFFESISSIAPAPPVRYLSRKKEVQEITLGRTCYDHLAGKLGVHITNYLLENGYLVQNNKEAYVTEKGSQFFNEQGIDLDALKKQKRIFCSMCLDWSERTHHVSGSVGHALYQLFLNNQWIVKSKQNRSVTLTKKGVQEVKAAWGLDLSEENYFD